MLATLASTLPTGTVWTYEVKWDGYCTLAAKDGPKVTLYSRNMHDATRQYAAIAPQALCVGLDRHPHLGGHASQHGNVLPQHNRVTL